MKVGIALAGARRVLGIAFAAGLLWGACSGTVSPPPKPPPEPPPPAPTECQVGEERLDGVCMCLEGYTRDHRDGVCKLPAPPPPPIRQPEDYITLERADTELDRFNGAGLHQLLQVHIFQAVRDINVVAGSCPDAFGSVFSLKLDEATDFAQQAGHHHTEARQLEKRLAVTNRRCADDPRYCGRSDVRKAVLARVKGAIQADLEVGGQLRSEMPPGRRPPCADTNYDSIAGWCTRCGKH